MEGKALGRGVEVYSGGRVRGMLVAGLGLL
jgi:hypothetical protein